MNAFGWTRCQGNCQQGRKPCDCDARYLAETEAGEGFADTQPMSDEVAWTTSDTFFIGLALLWSFGAVIGVAAAVAVWG